MGDTASVNIAGWLACLAFVVVLANQVLKLHAWVGGRAKPTSISGQPLSVSLAEKFVSSGKCDANMDSLRSEMVRQDKDIQRIDGEVHALRQEIRTDREVATQRILTEVKGVHERVNSIQQAVGRLEGKMNGHFDT